MARRPIVSPATHLLGVAGWKGSGKTTLIEKLLPLLRNAGLTVATVKHTHHPLRDHDGLTDGERHAKAGASSVVVLAPEMWELSGVPQPTPPPSLEAAVAMLGSADLILVEGFKSAPIPKIEVRGPNDRPPLAAEDPLVIAIATDAAMESVSVPVFARDDIDGLAAFILSYLRGPSRFEVGQGNHAGRSPDFQRRRT
jgi:molybdopterin-guanine dinucleotide biosynthesis adapter protein